MCAICIVIGLYQISQATSGGDPSQVWKQSVQHDHALKKAAGLRCKARASFRSWRQQVFPCQKKSHLKKWMNPVHGIASFDLLPLEHTHFGCTALLKLMSCVSHMFVLCLLGNRTYDPRVSGRRRGVEHGSASYSQPRAVLLHPVSQSGHDIHACGRPRRWWLMWTMMMLTVLTITEDPNNEMIIQTHTQYTAAFSGILA